MPQRLLLLEIVAKGGLGLLLAILPLVIVRIAGLPRQTDPFWVRLAGGLLLGIAGAGLLQAQVGAGAQRALGFGLGGFVVINLTLAGTLMAALAVRPAPTRRGRLILWLASLLLAMTALVELAYV